MLCSSHCARGTATVKTILVIENDAETLRLEQQVLAHAGYRAETAAEAGEARRRAQATAYHAIVLDLAVPGSEGYALAAEIAGRGPNRQTPLIILGADEPDGRRRAFEAGAVAFLPKPITADALRAVIRTVVSPAGGSPPSPAPGAPRPAAGLRPAPPAGPPSALPRPAPVAAPALAPAARTAPAAARPAAATGVAATVAVRFPGGPAYTCEPDPDGGWRCGRCELGLIGSAHAGSRCGVCHAEVLGPEPRSGSGLVWLVVVLAVGLLLGWALLQWWS